MADEKTFRVQSHQLNAFLTPNSSLIYHLTITITPRPTPARLCPAANSSWPTHMSADGRVAQCANQLFGELWRGSQQSGDAQRGEQTAQSPAPTTQVDRERQNTASQLRQERPVRETCRSGGRGR